MVIAGQIFATADDVSDTHQIIVYDVSKIIGRITVRLHQDLILQLAVVTADFAEYGVGIDGAALKRHLLSDNKGKTRIEIFLHLLGGEVAAMTVIAADGILLVELLKPLLGAEAIISGAKLDKLFGVFHINGLALALDVGTVVSAYVGTLVIGKTCNGKGRLNNVGRALYKTLTVGVLNAKDKAAVVVLGDEIRVKRGAKVADVHISRRAGGETGHCFSVHTDILLNA